MAWKEFPIRLACLRRNQHRDILPVLHGGLEVVCQDSDRNYRRRHIRNLEVGFGD